MKGGIPMSTVEMETRLRSLVIEQLGVDETVLKPESSFTDDLGADSLDLVELIMAIEEEFGIEIPDDQAEEIRTVGDAVAYLKKNIPVQPQE
jgi:acyl carrier protein